MRVALAVWLSVVPSVVYAQTASPLWGELEVPGSAAAVRRIAGLGDARERWDAALLIDLIHRYQTPTGWAEPVGRIDAAVKYWTALRGHAAAGPDGLRMPAASPSSSSSHDLENFKRDIELLGLSIRERDRQNVVVLSASEQAVQRGKWLDAIGISRDNIAKDLNAQRTVMVVVPRTVLPLPVPEAWSAFVFQKGHLPVGDLLQDRAAVLLYTGLLSVDAETLKYFSERPQLLKRLHESRAAGFGAFARSLRIRQGAVDVPGGASAVAIWESFAGRPVREPDSFIFDLLGRDGFRLAYFYDAVDRMDRAHQQFVLGASVPAKDRGDWVRDVYGVILSADSAWAPDVRPFSRPAPDPMLMVTSIDLTESGQPGPGWLAPLLDRVVSDDSWPERPADTLKNLKDRPADARWLLRWANESPAVAVNRARLLQYAQRNFGQVERTAAPDVEVALRGFREMPAMMLAIERMGLRDPALLARMARAGRALTTSGDRDDAHAVVSRWQVAVALLEQIQRRQHMAPQVLTRLVEPLAAAGVLQRERVGDAITAWTTDVLLPQFLAAGASPQSAEAFAIDGFVRAQRGPPVRADWDGLFYVLDTDTEVVRHARAMREGAPLQIGDLLALHDIHRKIQAGVKTVAEAGPLAAELQRQHSRLSRLPAGTVSESALNDLNDAGAALKRLKNPKDLKNVVPQAQRTQRMLNEEWSAIFPPLVYALAVAPMAQPAAIYADAWRHHTLLPEPQDYRTPWESVAWRSPQSDARPGGGMLVRGAWFSIDLVLADARLPLVRDVTSVRGATDVERSVLVSSLPIRFDLIPAEAELTSLAAALARGRSVLDTWRRNPASRTNVVAALRAARIDEWRVGLFAWVLEHDPDRAATGITVADVARLGGAMTVPMAWGVPSMPFDGCLCFRRDDGGYRDAWRPHWDIGLVAAVTTDLQLRIAEHLSTLKLPLSLAVELMPAATSDWLARINPYAPDDWEGFALWPNAIDLEHVESYLNQLISAGRLVKSAGLDPR